MRIDFECYENLAKENLKKRHKSVFKLKMV